MNDDGRKSDEIDAVWDVYRMLVKEVVDTSGKVVYFSQALCTEEALGDEEEVCDAAGHDERSDRCKWVRWRWLVLAKRELTRRGHEIRHDGPVKSSVEVIVRFVFLLH